jgi:hypothetical protein
MRKRLIAVCCLLFVVTVGMYRRLLNVDGLWVYRESRLGTLED